MKLIHEYHQKISIYENGFYLYTSDVSIFKRQIEIDLFCITRGDDF